ncbi:hypothetical protein D7V94_22045 [Parablautia intestinalis]|uniref:Uncharacterized protein n=1 Tax=Parablautia intestinalis TaxID=2320100 RepID=A0A3A9A693_9FIRM|nr:hypothetical protein [Parablautia intestinalis]RKI86937.1 hypothetical protein D7V94_22045 [Parablautia intestinalis]
MNFPIPDFVPVPSAEIMQTIRVVSLIVGICLVGVGLLFQFLFKKNFFCNKKKEKKATALWVVIGIGVLLIANHGIQLLF